MKTILTVDVGNSRAKFGLFEIGAAQTPQVLSITAVRLRDTENPAAELAGWLEANNGLMVSGSIVSGSNPSERDTLLQNWPLSSDEHHVIKTYSDVPLRLNVNEPDQVGIDRLLTGLAARRMVAAQQPVIVIDSGTATTVNLTTSDNTFQGGAILPGLRLSAYALHDYTARLPLVDTDQISHSESVVDAPLPGRNTTAAMRSGLFWGQLGAVKELSSRLTQSATEEFGESSEPAIVLTGGGGRQLVSHIENAVYVDSLTLHGLSLLSEHLDI